MTKNYHELPILNGKKNISVQKLEATTRSFIIASHRLGLKLTFLQNE